MTKINLILIFGLGLFQSCTFNNAKEDWDSPMTKHYFAIDNRDTAKLSLNFSGDRFYGKLTIIKPGNVIDVGNVEGDIKNGLLLGSYYFKQHRTQNNKRKAVAFLYQDSIVLSGTGTEEIYMGIPSFAPATLSFDNPKYSFKRVK